MKDIRHWYDGWFYENFIAANQDVMFEAIMEIVNPNSSILDVGCGTGRMAYILINKYKSYTGIDLSSKNIKSATDSFSSLQDERIKFWHKNIEAIVKEKRKYNYSIMTYVLHEIELSERIPTLYNMLKVSDSVIIGDYHLPSQKKWQDRFNEIVEFIAGRDHYRNYKSYIKQGGLKGIVESAKLKIEIEIKNSPITSHIIKISKTSIELDSNSYVISGKCCQF